MQPGGDKEATETVVVARGRGDDPSRLHGSDIGMAFEGVQALEGVDVDANKGEILGLIGPNGAGKTTLINVLSGLQKPTTGQVFLDERDVTSFSLPKMARHGVSRSFQGARLFSDLTVRQNLEIPALACGASPREAKARTAELLARGGIERFADEKASALSAGEQQRLGVLRALSIKPAFLLLDEPAAGLNELEGQKLAEMIRAARDELGCGVLIIEHDMSVIMSLCDRVQVLNNGRTIKVGTCEEVKSDPAVIDAYLGTDLEHAES